MPGSTNRSASQATAATVPFAPTASAIRRQKSGRTASSEFSITMYRPDATPAAAITPPAAPRFSCLTRWIRDESRYGWTTSTSASSRPLSTSTSSQSPIDCAMTDSMARVIVSALR